MPSITFDRFDGGMLLARPSSVAPANSLSHLFNLDVKPGGWLRGRPTWRHTSENAQMKTAWQGLESNGGFLWTFCRGDVSSPASYTTYLGVRDNGGFITVSGKKAFVASFDHLTGTDTDYPDDRLIGTTRWNGGFVGVWYNHTTGTMMKAMFQVVRNGASIDQVIRTNITDVNMPRSGIMVTAGSRVYAASNDGKSVNFCKVGDPTDWTTAGNAGTLPVAQHFGSGQRIYALGIYQGKLAVFTDQSMQLWNIDPDPTNMSLDRVIDGVGTRHHRSLVSLNTDLLFLSDSGVRSITTLANSEFPTDVDTGLPIASAMRPVAEQVLWTGTNSDGPIDSRVIALGASPFAQYWIHAKDAWSWSFVGNYFWAAWSYSRQAKLNAWAMHTTGGSPRAIISAWAVLGNSVYMRNDKDTYLEMMTPEVWGTEQTESGTFNICDMITQWLDFKLPGNRKSITGIDFDGKNITSISVQTSVGGSRTGVTADTVAVGNAQGGWTYSGEVLPMNADGTEFRFFFNAGGSSEVQLNRFTIYFDDLGRA